MPVLPIVDQLPESYLTLIGEIVTAWAVQENELRQTAFLLLKVDPKRGRIAVRSARAKETVEMISDLMSLTGLQSKAINLKGLASLLDEIEKRRNTLAHNVWLKGEGGQLLVQSFAGVWPKDSSGKGNKRRIDPAGIAISEKDLKHLLEALRGTIVQCRQLRAEIAKQMGAGSIELKVSAK